MRNVQLAVLLVSLAMGCSAATADGGDRNAPRAGGDETGADGGPNSRRSQDGGDDSSATTNDDSPALVNDQSSATTDDSSATMNDQSSATMNANTQTRSADASDSRRDGGVDSDLATAEAAPDPTTPAPTTQEAVDAGAAPDDCTIEEQQTSADACELTRECRYKHQYAICEPPVAGVWPCKCSSGNKRADLEIIAHEAPCAEAVDLCDSLDPLIFTGDEPCTLTYEAYEVDLCEMETRCVHSVALNDHASASSSVLRSDSCRDLGNGQLGCSCESSRSAKSFTLSGIALLDACRFAHQQCDPDAATAFPGAEDCTLDRTDADEDLCDLEWSCSRGIEFEGTTGEILEPESAYCRQTANGTECQCATNNGYYDYLTEAPFEGTTTCHDALEVCRTNEPRAEAPLDCVVQTLAANEGACSGQVQCSQQATSDGIMIELRAPIISTFCLPDVNGWSCQCEVGPRLMPIDVDTDDAAKACSEAGAACPALLNIENLAQ